MVLLGRQLANSLALRALSSQSNSPIPSRDPTRRVCFCFSLVIIITLLFSSTVEKIINYTIFLDCIGMSTSAATIFILRRRKMGERPAGEVGGKDAGVQLGKDFGEPGRNDAGPDIYRMKLFPLMPLVFILAYIAVGVSIILDDPRSAAYGALIFGGFFVVYFVVEGVKKARRVA